MPRVAGPVRSDSEPRSLTNICFCQVYTGTDCHSEAPTSALRRGTVMVLTWCQRLLKAHFPARRWNPAARVVAEVFGTVFGKGQLTSSDSSGVYFSAFSVLPEK